MIWLRWAAEVVEGLQKKQAQSKRRPEKTGQTPSDGKVSLTGMKFQVFWESSLRKVLTLLGFKPVLYIEILGTVICLNNLPKICGNQRVRS